MNLSGRLKAIANAVPACKGIADIGTDHGYIPLYLVQRGIAEKAVATDISPGSLMKAQTLIREYQMDHVIDTREGSGLAVLTAGEVDTIVIAGMGGLLIKDILEADPEVARSASRLILQPMVAQDVLRRWLVENDYVILDEDLVKEEHRIYEIISVSTGKQTIDKNAYYDIGYKLIEKQHPLLEEFVNKKINSLEEILEQLGKSNTHATYQRTEQLKQKLRQYKEVYRWDIQSRKS